MKKVIKKKIYNTETAIQLAEYDNGARPKSSIFYEEILYIKRTGEYFLYCVGGGDSKYGEWHGDESSYGEQIIPYTLREAKRWAEKHLDDDEYEKIFGDIEDDEMREEQQQFAVLLPATILNNLKTKKSETGMTISAQIIRALREAGY